MINLTILKHHHYYIAIVNQHWHYSIVLVTNHISNHQISFKITLKTRKEHQKPSNYKHPPIKHQKAHQKHFKNIKKTKTLQKPIKNPSKSTLHPPSPVSCSTWASGRLGPAPPLVEAGIHVGLKEFWWIEKLRCESWVDDFSAAFWCWSYVDGILHGILHGILIVFFTVFWWYFDGSLGLKTRQFVYNCLEINSYSRSHTQNSAYQLP